MWSQIVLGDQDKSGSEQPINRFKHASALSNEDLYIYGGKKLTPDGLSISSTHSNLKDFWKLELRTGRWTEIKPKILNSKPSTNTSSSSRSRILPSRLRLRLSGHEEESFWPPPLVDATLCSFKNSLYLFGGEIGLQAHDELKTRTPLWIYDIQNDEWRKWENSGAEAPSPRRCHSATVYSEYMLIYGGYQDLKGSIGCLWAFHFDTESWHLFSSPDNKIPRNGISSFNKYFQKGYRLRYNNANPTEEVINNLTIIQPLPRHSHAAQFHGTSLWVYGGMSDLEDLQDLWRFDFDTKKWSQIKKKSAWPGQLKGHSLLKALNSLFIFGGIKSDYHKKFNEDLWRYDFINESWQKITIHGAKPHARSFPNYIMLPALIRILPAKRSKERRSSIEDGYWWDFSAEDETLSSYNLSESATSASVARRNSGGNEYLLLEGENHNDNAESCLAQESTIIDNDENAITESSTNINTYADDQEEYEDELEETISPISPLGPSTGPILKNMIRYSESANEFGSALCSSTRSNNNGIKKSNSVRFNDCLTSTNGNCSSNNGKNNHPKLRNSTSDYVSMEMLSRSHSNNGNNQQQSNSIQNTINSVVTKSTSFFENPNYQNFENPTPSPGGNSEEDSYELQRISRDSEEPEAIIDSTQYEIMTPNYLLLIGGQEHGLKKKDLKNNENNSMTLWRLRVSSELIETNMK